MNQQKISGFYNEVLRAEKLPPVPLKFCRVAKAGACVSYNPVTMVIDSCQLDLNRCNDPEYAILHEIAHIAQITKKRNAGHNAAFKKEEARLVDQYMYSQLSFKYFAS